MFTSISNTMMAASDEDVSAPKKIKLSYSELFSDSSSFVGRDLHNCATQVINAYCGTADNNACKNKRLVDKIRARLQRRLQKNKKKHSKSRKDDGPVLTNSEQNIIDGEETSSNNENNRKI